jgi:hypothetical protein
MRLSRERLLLRKGVIDGVGRVARVMYEPETMEPLPALLGSTRCAARTRRGRSDDLIQVGTASTAGERQHRSLLVERAQSCCGERVPEFLDLRPLTPSHCGEGERGIVFG